MSTENLLTILVISCDEYSDLWHDFFTCKEQNWADCPYPTMLATNVKPYTFDDVQVIHCGERAQWSTRARIALESIRTKYVCLLLEDFFISKPVKNQDIQDALMFMEDAGIKYYKLDSFSAITTATHECQAHLRVIPASLRYGVSLLSAIWNRDYLLEKIGDKDYNAWKFEIDRNKEAAKARETGDETVLGVYDDRDILNICHMVVQGKFLPNAIHEMKEKCYVVDVSQREVMSEKEQFIYRMKGKFSPLAQKFPWIRNVVAMFGIQSVSLKNDAPPKD